MKTRGTVSAPDGSQEAFARLPRKLRRMLKAAEERAAMEQIEGILVAWKSPFPTALLPGLVQVLVARPCALGLTKTQLFVSSLGGIMLRRRPGLFALADTKLTLKEG